MKVKSLFLSVCAIAALAGCSKNDDIVTSTDGEAPKAKVIIKLEGDGVVSRAAGDPETPTEDGAAIKNVTVFFFNSTDFIVGKPQYVGDPSTLATTPLTTTTDAAKIVVMANLGDQTGGVFSTVSSLSQLKKTDFSSISASAVNQSKTNLYSSGMGAITMTDNTGTATVQLHFVSARVKTVKIAWKAGQNYAASKADFDGTTTNWFYIKQVYMMTAQTNSPLIPAGATANAWTGGFTPQSYAFAGGVAWGTAPWTWEDAGGIGAPVQSNDYLVSTMPAATGNSIANVLGDNAWYMFENSPASGHPTGLIVEIVWRSKENSTNADELLTKYFTIYFGEKAGTGNLPLLEAGKTYDMSIALNGEFTPGGNAGGGGDDPTKPSVDAQVTVTVTPAQWVTTAEISKEFE